MQKKTTKKIITALCITGFLMYTASSKSFFLLTQYCTNKSQKTISKTKFGQISLLKKSKTLNNLPKEILYQIYSFSNSDYRNLLNLGQVSKHTYKSLLYFLKNQKKLKIKIQGKPKPDLRYCCSESSGPLEFPFGWYRYACCRHKLQNTITQIKERIKNLKTLISILNDKTLFSWIKKNDKSLDVDFKSYKSSFKENINKNKLKRHLSVHRTILATNEKEVKGLQKKLAKIKRKLQEEQDEFTFADEVAWFLFGILGWFFEFC
ncbi:F-box protein [Candidatus Dependentiae bacterium]